MNDIPKPLAARHPVGKGIPDCSGYSLVEILVVIAAIAVLAGLGIMAVSGVVQSSKAETARANLEYLNAAVRKYNHAVRELTNWPLDGIGDETDVFTELKIELPLPERLQKRPGSPYLASHFSLVPSSDTTKYRARWNGYEFQLIEPGSGGIGIDLMELQ